MTHATAVLLAAGAALDDLAPAERALYEAHRATCSACGHLEAELAGVLADLALAAPKRVPPPALLAGIRQAIRAEADRA